MLRLDGEYTPQAEAEIVLKHGHFEDGAPRFAADKMPNEKKWQTQTFWTFPSQKWSSMYHIQSIAKPDPQQGHVPDVRTFMIWDAKINGHPEEKRRLRNFFSYLAKHVNNKGPPAHLIDGWSFYY